MWGSELKAMCMVVNRALVYIMPFTAPNSLVDMVCMIPRKISSSVSPVNIMRISAGATRFSGVSVFIQGVGFINVYSMNPKAMPSSATGS